MSLLPTTRITTLVSTSSNSGADTGIIPGQDEDILLVDFQPVVNVNSQILSSPSTTTSTAMYPLPPPSGQLPGAHMVGLNHQPSVSSDGITTPLSATGSSGKAQSNSNNFSLVSLSNHVHQNNNTSREGSDLSYPPHSAGPPPVPYHHHHLYQPGRIGSGEGNNLVNQNNVGYDDDEDDEFARHQALAQPSYMLNKRRSRRFTANRDSHVWDNMNHVGHHHQQGHLPQMSSSISSSEESDTGFLMGTRKTAYTRRSVQRVVDPYPASTVGQGNMSPSATTGLLPHLGSRKRVRRRRPSARNRKPVNNQRDKIPNPSDVLSLCCCLCEDDHPTRSGSHRSSSFKSRYFGLIIFLVAIIVIAVLTSITVSLQRKVDSLDSNLKKMDQALGSPLAIEPSNGESNVHKPKESFEALLSSHNELNLTVVTLKDQLDQILTKLQDFQKQLTSATSKPDGVSEVRGELAKLGSRVEELSATIEKLKKINNNNNNNNNNSSDNNGKDPKNKNGSNDQTENHAGDNTSS